jgi:hypothetical protein
VLTWIFAVGWLLVGNAPLAVWVLSGRPLPAFPIIGELNNGAFYYWFSYRVFGYLILAQCRSASPRCSPRARCGVASGAARRS